MVRVRHPEVWEGSRMKRSISLITVLTFAAVCFHVRVAGAQADSTCEGDFNLDGQVTVEEIIVAVNNALSGCGGTPEQGCINSGGTVSTAPCCSGVGDFPDTCGIGACGCAPQFSTDVSVCNCGTGKCFSRNQGACVVR